MLWSFPRRAATRHTPRIVGISLAAGSALAANGMVCAAELYVQPSASMTFDNNSNLDLEPNEGAEVQGFIAKLAGLFSISSPTWDTTIRPRLEYRDYPKDSADNRLEGYLDVASNYRGLRSSASIIGTFEHRDDVNAELSSALFDQINPVPPTAPQTGQATIGVTRDSLLLLPKYTYDITPVVGAGVSGIFQGIRYSPSNDVDQVDFNYYYGEAFVSWNYSQRSALSFGGYGSKYDATQFDSNATGAGVNIEWNSSWTRLLSTDATVVYQRTKVDQTVPVIVRDTTNTWGATFGAVYKAQISQYRLNIGRIITPSGGGGVYVNDQVQFQYSRDLTERWAFTGALIALHNHPITSGQPGGYDRDYGQAVVETKWMLTPTWYVLGGYQYAYQKFKTEPNSASNNRVYITLGYLGLPRQR
jgi:hypothetical protein